MAKNRQKDEKVLNHILVAVFELFDIGATYRLLRFTLDKSMPERSKCNSEASITTCVASTFGAGC